jgi:ribosomal protein S6
MGMVYQTVVICRPDIDTSKPLKFKQLCSLQSQLNGYRSYCKDVGNRQLAYDIKGYNTGIYYEIIWAGIPKNVETLEQFLRADPDVLKFVTVTVCDIKDYREDVLSPITIIESEKPYIKEKIDRILKGETISDEDIKIEYEYIDFNELIYLLDEE